MARHSQRLVAIVMMINYNCGADLSRGTRIRHLEEGKSPCSMGAPFQLGTNPSSKKFRLIESPLGSVHNFKGFFSSAVLPTKYSGPLIMQGCRKENCIRPELARSPAKDIQTWLITTIHATATTASSDGYNDDLVNSRLLAERWGGGFIQPIANKQDSLVKVSIATVCGN